jgi:hypothetical protein
LRVAGHAAEARVMRQVLIMKCSWWVAALAAGIALGSPVSAPGAATPAAVEDILSADYTRANTVDQIPWVVLTALLGLMEHDPRLANPGDRFNATDVVDSELATRRLVFAAGTSTSWLIYYEHGGLGYHRHLVVFTLAGDSAACRCVGKVGKDLKDFTELRRAGRKGLVTCDPCPRSPDL